MYRLFKSKKAIGVDDFFPLLLTIFIFIIGVLFLMVDYTSKQKEKINTIEEFQREIKGADLLHMFLQTPVDNTDIMSMIETNFASIPEDYSGKKTIYLEYIEGKNWPYMPFYKNTKEIMRNLYPTDWWKLEITTTQTDHENGLAEYWIIGENPRKSEKVTLVANALLPTANPNSVIEVRLYIG